MSIDRYDQTAGSIFPTLLAAFGADAADLLSRQLEIVSIAGGQILFSEGDEADALYIVASGSVGISTEDESGILMALGTLPTPPRTMVTPTAPPISVERGSTVADREYDPTSPSW